MEKLLIISHKLVKMHLDALNRQGKTMNAYDKIYKIVYNLVSGLKRPTGNMGIDVLGLALSVPHYTTGAIAPGDLRDAIVNAYADYFFGGCEGDGEDGTWYQDMAQAAEELATFIRDLKMNAEAKFPDTSTGKEMARQGSWEMKKYLDRFTG